MRHVMPSELVIGHLQVLGRCGGEAAYILYSLAHSRYDRIICICQPCSKRVIESRRFARRRNSCAYVLLVRYLATSMDVVVEITDRSSYNADLRPIASGTSIEALTFDLAKLFIASASFLDIAFLITVISGSKCSCSAFKGASLKNRVSDLR